MVLMKSMISLRYIDVLSPENLLLYIENLKSLEAFPSASIRIFLELSSIFLFFIIEVFSSKALEIKLMKSFCSDDISTFSISELDRSLEKYFKNLLR